MVERVIAKDEVEGSNPFSRSNFENRGQLMPDELTIRRAIEQIATVPSTWTIGVTDRPDARRAEHGNPTYWHQ